MLFNSDNIRTNVTRLGYGGDDILEAQRLMLAGQGYTNPSVYDAWMDYLGNLGYTGTLQDRMYAAMVAGGYGSLEEWFNNLTFSTPLENATLFMDWSQSTSFAYKTDGGALVTTDNNDIFVTQDANGLSLAFSSVLSGWPSIYKAGPPQANYCSVVASATRYARLYATSAPGTITGSPLNLDTIMGASGSTVIVAVKTDTYGDGLHHAVFGGQTTSQYDIRNYQSGGNYYARVTAWDGGSKSVTLQTPANGNWYVFSARHDGADLEARVNQGAWSSTGCGPLTALANNAAMYICGGMGGAMYGYWGSIVVFDSALSDDDVTAVENELATKFSITF